MCRVQRVPLFALVREGGYRKLDERAGAHLIALPAPRLPRAMSCAHLELGLVESLSHETVRLRLKKTPSNHGRRSSGAFLR